MFLPKKLNFPVKCTGSNRRIWFIKWIHCKLGKKKVLVCQSKKADKSWVSKLFWVKLKEIIKDIQNKSQKMTFLSSHKNVLWLNSNFPLRKFLGVLVLSSTCSETDGGVVSVAYGSDINSGVTLCVNYYSPYIHCKHMS